MKKIWIFSALLWAMTGLAQANRVNSEPLTMNQAVQEALQNNLGLQLAHEDEEMAKGAALAQEGIFDPQLSAGTAHREAELTPTYLGGVSEDEEANWQVSIAKRLSSGTELDLSWQNKRTSNDLAINTIEPAYSSALMLNIRQPLLQGFGNQVQLAALQAAEKHAAAANFSVKSQAAELASQVKSAYWQLLFNRQDIEVKKLSLKMAEQLRDDTAERIKAGSLAQVEIYQPESEVARREQQLIGAERAIGVAEDGLKLLLNRNNWQQGIQPTDLPPSMVAVPDLKRVLAKALAQRPDLQAAELQVEAARFQEKNARDRIRPSLDLSGVFGLSGVDDGYGHAIDTMGSNGKTVWQVGLLFSKPLGNNLAKGQHQQAKASLNRTRTQTALLQQEIHRQTRQAVRDILLANKAVEATIKTSLATQKRLEAQQAKFEVGLATTYDVLVAQESYAQALAGENLSKVQLAIASAELDRIQGLVSLRQ